MKPVTQVLQAKTRDLCSVSPHRQIDTQPDLYYSVWLHWGKATSEGYLPHLKHRIAGRKTSDTTTSTNRTTLPTTSTNRTTLPTISQTIVSLQLTSLRPTEPIHASPDCPALWKLMVPPSTIWPHALFGILY